MGQTLSEPVTEKVRSPHRHRATAAAARRLPRRSEPARFRKLPVLNEGSYWLTRDATQHSDEGQDDRVAFGVSCMQGWRISMEDAHAAILDLQQLEGEGELKPAASDVRISFFGVYDGHGGDKVALYTGEHLHKIVGRLSGDRQGDPFW
jgi:hypothetical protein